MQTSNQERVLQLAVAVLNLRADPGAARTAEFREAYVASVHYLRCNPAVAHDPAAYGTLPVHIQKHWGRESPMIRRAALVALIESNPSALTLLAEARSGYVFAHERGAAHFSHSTDFCSRCAHTGMDAPMDADVHPPVREKRTNESECARPSEACTACGEAVIHRLRIDEIVPELADDLVNTNFCSYTCAQEYCRFLVQNSAADMGKVAARFGQYLK